jgi:hypothetical protein
MTAPISLPSDAELDRMEAYLRQSHHLSDHRIADALNALRKQLSDCKWDSKALVGRIQTLEDFK